VTNYSLISKLEYQGKPIRRARLEDGTEVWVVTDGIGAVTGSKNPQNYWYKTRGRMKEEGCEWVTNCHILKIKAADGKYYDTQVMTLPQFLRMLQSLPSKKAEPFRAFMAEAGYTLIKEAQNPDLAIKRGYENYRRKGMTPEMAMRRAKSVLHRNVLTDQWKRRGISEPKEFAMLTDRESKGVFGKTTSEMKRDRDLAPVQSLRDNMSLSELMAQDVADTAISLLVEKNNPYGYDENAVEVDKGSSVGARVLADLNRLLEE
ncbi:MAG: hypothetical protein IIY98_00270, partial [Aeriscardovia sp.]|nr:hypothetical protein [Aeriscardovia sp.]